MEISFRNKIALVTGGGRGIGKKIIEDFLARGCKVINLTRSLPKINKKTNKNLISIKCDLANLLDVKKKLKILRKRKLSPDIIINNVGGNLNITNPFSPVSKWKEVYELNFFNSIEINNFFIKKMKMKKWGRICFISSISALEQQGTPQYCSAKAAVNAYVRSVGRFVAKDGIIITSVMPGAVFTEGGYWDIKKTKNSKLYKKYIKERMAIGRIGKVNEISNFVIFLCSNKSSFAVGSSFLVDGGQGRAFYPNI